MTSRERVLSAIAHKQPDRVPVDMGATPSSGISAIAYSNLLKHLGRTELPVQIYDVVQQLAPAGYVDHRPVRNRRARHWPYLQPAAFRLAGNHTGKW